jgi:hypothetical protein
VSDAEDVAFMAALDRLKAKFGCTTPDDDQEVDPDE